MTNSDALEEYLDYLILERGLAKSTIENYSLDLKRFINWLSENHIHFAECDSKKLEDFLNNVAASEDYSPTSVARHFSSLRGFLQYLHQENEYPYATDSILASPKLGRYLPQCLTVEEINIIFSRIAELSKNPLRDTALLELLYSAGLRISEALSIRLQDIDFDNEWLMPIGKGNKQRLVPLGTKAKNNLLAWIQKGRPLTNPQSDCVILNARGKPLTRMGAWKIIHSFTAEFGKRISPHTFRHSFATHCLIGGMDLRILQEILGHADLTTTQIYTHLDNHFLRQEYEQHHPRELKQS